MVSEPRMKVPRWSSTDRRRGFSRAFSAAREMDHELSQREMSHRHIQNRGATKIQQAYRRLKYMYRSFGHMLFCRKEAAASDFGKLTFPGARSDEAANFISEPAGT